VWYEKSGMFVVINAKIQPSSSVNKIAGVVGEELKILIKAPPVENAANKELIRFLSKKFKIPKKDIEIKGEKSRKKRIKILPNSKLEDFLREVCEE
jgi:uncharacterized protein (TIGR00251 family)